MWYSRDPQSSTPWRRRNLSRTQTSQQFRTRTLARGASQQFQARTYSLTGLEKTYPHAKAVATMEILARYLEQPYGLVASHIDGREMVALLTANCFANDEVEPQKWRAGFEYVLENLQSWLPQPGVP